MWFFCNQTQTFYARGKGRSSSQIMHDTSTSKGSKSPAPLSAKEEALFKALGKRKRDLNQNMQLEDAGKFEYQFL